MSPPKGSNSGAATNESRDNANHDSTADNTDGPTPMNIDTDEPTSNTTADTAPPVTTTPPATVTPPSVDINVNSSREQMVQQAKERLQSMSSKALILFGNYTHLCATEPGTPKAEKARQDYQEFEAAMVNLKATINSFCVSTTDSMDDPISFVGASARRSIVPDKLPFLQLKTDSQTWKPKEEVFDSVLDFCTAFEKILRAHSLVFDQNWERLLPMSLNNVHNSWCTEKLLSMNYSWEQAKAKLLDYFDSPYRKFMLMTEVGALRQGRTESTRDYAAKFQKLRREAGFQDGVQLVVCFWCSLTHQVRKSSLSTIASKYGKNLPEKIDEMVDLVCANGDDSTLMLPVSSASTSSSSGSHGSHGSNSHSYSSGHLNRKGYDKKSYIHKSDKSFQAPRRPCRYCHKPWTGSSHKCKEYFEQLKSNIQEHREALQNSPSNAQMHSRMAYRSIHAPTLEQLEEDERVVNETLNSMSIKCKSNKKLVNVHDTNIIFPVLVNNRRAMSLLDSGADFSSVDLHYCKNNNLTIKYFNKNDISANSVIKLGDNNFSTKRIGTCLLTIKCNNKTLTREFEVMNLANLNNQFQLSIGTDYMSLLGIGVTGLPVTYDDQASSARTSEANFRYNQKSDLLQSIEIESKLLENSPAGSKIEHEQALMFIQPYIEANARIPKGSFCTIPESVVTLDTPPDAKGYRPPYPIPLVYHKIVDDQVQEWLDNGLIRRAPRNVNWNCPLTVVKKTNSRGDVTGHRVCHDPRHINILLRSSDRMPLPVIHDLFEELKGATVYSTLDLKSAFNSLKLDERDAHKLSFTWRNVQYTPIATMFGVKHVSSQFQRTMSIALEGITSCRFFVDDIVCFSSSIEQHKRDLKLVIERLTAVNLRLNPAKCKFFQSQIYLLGFHISPQGISMDRRKLVNVLEYPQPKTGKDIQRFCGVINYFAPLIPNVSYLTAPLNGLRSVTGQLGTRWQPTHQHAFLKLKAILLSDIIISYPDLNHPFCIATDASNVGIGVVLFQKYDNKIHYTSFMAKSLSKSERNYSVNRRELLAIVYALKKFHKYIYGSHFIVYSDHKSLAYLHTQKIANAMLINWLDIILQYDFEIVHLPGNLNILPDRLSRLFEEDYIPTSELVGDNVAMINRNVTLNTGENSNHHSKEPLLSINSGEYVTPSDKDRHLLLLKEHIKGHFGSDAIYYSLRRQGIYWTNLKNDAIELVKYCIPCQQINIVQKGYNPLKPIVSPLPGDSWGIDLAGPFTTSARGNNYLLIMIDHASKFSLLRAIPDKSSGTIAEEVTNVICDFGPFRKLVSDNGTEFVNDLMSTLRLSIGFEHALISTYHPRSNGASERTVQSAVKTIKKYLYGNKADWDTKVRPVQLFLNIKYNERTKTPPFTLMFGRNANDFQDFSQEKDTSTKAEIEAELHRKVKEMQEVVYPAIYEKTKKFVEKQKEAFDASHKLIEFPVGSQVMIRILEKKDKLDPNYIGFYTVVNKTAAGTYVLCNEKNEIEPKRYPPSLLKLAPQHDVQGDYFDVDHILDHFKLDDNTYIYKVRWKNFDSSYDTWEPAESFTDPNLITEYWRAIGVIPQSRKEVNKANKKLLKGLNNKQNTNGKRTPSNNNSNNNPQSGNRRSKRIKRTN